MADLIDREVLLEGVDANISHLRDVVDGDSMLNRAIDLVQYTRDFIAAQSTIDPASLRPKGEWLKSVDNDCEMHKCSVCGARVAKGLYEYENPNHFCYHCGADMRGESK